MNNTRPRGNVSHDRFVADTMYDLLEEQKKTNNLLSKLVNTNKAEGTAEKIGKILDRRGGRKG